MSTSIHRKVQAANSGEYEFAIIKLKSGWVMAAERPLVPGYCLLFSDPVVKNLNSLNESERAQYCLDMARVGDALLQVTNAEQINYETWGNLDRALHTHIVPRYADEDPDKRILPVCRAYDGTQAPTFDPVLNARFIQNMKEFLRTFSY
jgi:diadenosine tetraphosphate (Ap4A) HIT family hydrolase